MGSPILSNRSPISCICNGMVTDDPLNGVLRLPIGL